MSHVTDLVFITPEATWHDQQNHCDRFEASFLAAHGREIHPTEGQGKAMSTAVYLAGVNWIKPEWIAAVVADDWPEHTVLWLDIEGLMDQPNERVVHLLGPRAGRS